MLSSTMIGISPLHNRIQNYPWGSRTGIATFLGRPSPAAEPQAEMWMGAHARAPSEVEVDGRRISLAEVVAAAPEQVLGQQVVDRHGAALPFLFKVLAAGRGLSIQAHPDRHQAEAGYCREDRLGIARQAPERNYRDRNHKPEVLYAVTPFVILRGFRMPADILALLRRLDLPELMPAVGEALRASDLEGFFSAYMSLDAERLRAVLARAVVGARDWRRHDEAQTKLIGTWVAKLEQQFPGDRGILTPLFLHLSELSPGEAIFTGPGVLHAYLEGLGIELMANSDNVVRGGLTPKHVDVEELRRILRFEPEPPRTLRSTMADGERRFEAMADEFTLSVVEVAPGKVVERHGGGVEILLCSRGRGQIRDAAGAVIAFGRGVCLLVPAAAGSYRVEGNATLFRAAVPVDR